MVPFGMDLRTSQPANILLTEAGRGDDAAFVVLYTRMAPRVLGLIRRILCNRAQSEEVAQEVMLEVWQHAYTFDPGRGSAVAWILTRAHSRAVDRVRATAAATVRDEAAGRRELATEPASTEAIVEERLENERLHVALSELPVPQRSAIELCHLHGLSNAEAAEQLGVPIGTVKSRVRDGLARLRSRGRVDLGEGR